MVTVTAKILGPTDLWPPEDVELCMNSLLAETAYESDWLTSQPTLNHFQQECLLAYYDIHQFPGSPAWMMVYDAESATEDEIESWRYVWWCVYCLDSYTNISLGFPFVIDLESINTALVRRACAEDGAIPNTPKPFLPDEVDDLWRTIQEVSSSACEREFNIHIITTTLIRQTGTILRLRVTKKRVADKVKALKSSPPSLRLCLPLRYLNPTRNDLAGDSSARH
ncbi:hypothetical protein AAE478_005312 [Parahypoxylon ruwenzoriense]